MDETQIRETVHIKKKKIHRQRMATVRRRGGGKESYSLKRTEFQFGKMRTFRKVLMVVKEQCECT
jgi:hypothetical protein